MKTKQVTRLDIFDRARQIVKQYGTTCNLGGCHNHSGHEFCDMDEAWDRALARAEDELCNSEEETV